MKKLMIVAAAAFGMAAFGDIESSNIVGYSSGPNAVEGYNFVAVGFNSVGCNTFDIQQIRISDDGAGTIGWGLENFSIWAGGPDVVEGSGFFYYDPSMDPDMVATDYYWGDGDCVRAAYSVAPGQAVVVECADGLKVVSSGEVPTGSIELTTVEGYNFVANPFPVELDVQQIRLSDGDAGTIGWGLENFSIWAGGPDVVEGSGFFYYDPSMDPEMKATDYYWGNGDCTKVNYPIAIGQGVVVESAGDLTLTIEPSYK